MSPLTTAHILSGILTDGTVLLNYRLGLADGITVLSRRGTEPDFAPLAEDEPAPVIDARPKLEAAGPEVRRYLAILRYSANEVRQLSNEIVLVVP
jgi:hypothetical protein